MPTHYQSGFSQGAISKDFASNIDSQLYVKSCRKAVNVVLAPQGSARRRDGFVAFSSIQNEERYGMIEFQISLQKEEYIIQFFATKTVIVSTDESVETVINYQPYTKEQCQSISWAQTGTTIVIAVEGIAPHIIKRLDDGSFEFREANLQFGVVLDENRTTTTLTWAPAIPLIGATVTITASSPIFNAQMVGGVWAITYSSGNIANITLWETGQTIAVNDFRRFGENVYRATTSGTTGTLPPIHDRDDVSLSDGGVTWLFWNKGTGYVKFTTFISDTQFSGIVQRRIPPNPPTAYWNEGAFSQFRGFPSAVTFFQDRLIFGGSDQSISIFLDEIEPNSTQRLWASRTGDYANFDRSGTELTRSFAFDLVAKKANKIVWLASADELYVGTQSGIYPVNNIGLSFPTSKNISDSCSSVQPNFLNHIITFVPFSKSGIKATEFVEESQSIQSQKITFKNEPIFTNIIHTASIQEPSDQIVALLVTGSLSVLYFDLQQQVVGSYEFQIDNEKITSLCTLNSVIYIGTESGKFGKLDMLQKTNNHEDFGVPSSAFIETLPVGIAAQGQVLGFFQKPVAKRMRIQYFDTQDFQVNGRPVIDRRPSQDTESEVPFTEDIIEISLAESQRNKPIIISSIDNASFTIQSYGVLYQTSG